MKKLLYTLCFVVAFTPITFAQDFPEQAFMDGKALSEQAPYQQLIGYALEVGGAAFEAEKPVGKYKCDGIYSSEGYDAQAISSCEVIVHSDLGPIVVRYKEIDEDTSEKILAFLKENNLTENIRYSNGRFRFSFTRQEDEATSQLQK